MTRKTVTFDRADSGWRADGMDAKAHKLAFAMGSGEHEIAFEIGTPTGRFVFDTADPIWVSQGNTCPRSASSHADISVKECLPTRLVVGNANKMAATLRYQLNVIEKASGRRIPIDPIIENGGHGLL